MLFTGEPQCAARVGQIAYNLNFRVPTWDSQVRERALEIG